MRFKGFVLRKISCHLYGANSQYFKNAHTSGTPRQKTIISVASTWVPEMLNSVVASRRANKRLTPAGLKGKCRPPCHSSDLYMWGIWIAKKVRLSCRTSD